jgi:hypothetical protein
MLHTKNNNDIIYHIIHLPLFGNLQFNTESSLYPLIKFTQKDIDEGSL